MNKFRNEHEIKLGKTTYKLRATFNALAEIESELDKAIGEIYIQMSQGKVRMHQLRSIIIHGANASGMQVDEMQLEEDLMDAGLTSIYTQVVPFLAQAFDGTPLEKKAQPTNQ